MSFFIVTLANETNMYANISAAIPSAIISTYNNIYILLHDREGSMGKYQLEGDSIGPSAARGNTEPES